MSLDKLDYVLALAEERIAFCTLQQPVYTRTSVAAYRPENPRAALCREAIALTRELVLPRLELPV